MARWPFWSHSQEYEDEGISARRGQGVMEWAGSTLLTAAMGPHKNISAPGAPRAHFQTEAFAECYCHLVLPSSPCAQLPLIGVRAQPQREAADALHGHPGVVCGAPQVLYHCRRTC